MKNKRGDEMDPGCDCTTHQSRIGRRGFIAGAAAVSGFAMLGPVQRLVAAPGGIRRKLAIFYFPGGWDVLLGPDPRDPSGTYSGLDTGTALLAPRYQTPFPVTLGGRQTILGAPMAALAPHADVMTVIRGVNMNTVAHGTGQTYIYTGAEPSGVRPRISSLGTVLVAGSRTDNAPPLTNVAISIDSYNLGLRSDATAVPVSGYDQFATMIRPTPNTLAPQIEQALERAESMTDSCVGVGYAETSPGARIRENRRRLREIVKRNVAAKFAFDAADSEMVAMRALYGLNGNPANPAYYAATAAQALKNGLAQSVTVSMPAVSPAFDTHGSEWATIQPLNQEACWNALAAFITDLKQNPDPETGRPLIETTTVMACSEFSRTPKLNGANGRDHWFTNSVVLFGAGIKSAFFGATNRDDLGIIAVDMQTGDPNPAGTILKPDHVMATVVASAGLDPSPYRVEPIRALLV